MSVAAAMMWLHMVGGGRPRLYQVIFIAQNLLNTHLQQLLYICLLSVHHNESTNMVKKLFSDYMLNQKLTFIYENGIIRLAGSRQHPKSHPLLGL